MKHNMYAIEDKVARAFNQPFLAPNDETAIRNIRDSAAQGDTGFHQHPEDYRLYSLGVYSSETGVIEAELQPVMICNVTEIVNPAKQSHPTLEVEK